MFTEWIRQHIQMVTSREKLQQLHGILSITVEQISIYWTLYNHRILFWHTYTFRPTEHVHVHSLLCMTRIVMITILYDNLHGVTTRAPYTNYSWFTTVSSHYVALLGISTQPDTHSIKHFKQLFKSHHFMLQQHTTCYFCIIGNTCILYTMITLVTLTQHNTTLVHLFISIAVPTIHQLM